MVDFINEVEEELRKDDYNALLKKYGPLIAGVIILIIAGTGFLEWRKSAVDRTARASAASFTEALTTAQNGDVDAASQKFIQLSDVAPQGYAGLSLMQAASLKLEAGARTDAVRLFDQAAQKFTKPRHIQLAQLKAAYILAGDGAYDDVQSRLGSLMAKDAPYEFLARELMGFVAQKSGDDALAREQFAYLDTIPGVPTPIKERANQALTLMRSESATAPKTELDNISPVSSDVVPNATGTNETGKSEIGIQDNTDTNNEASTNE